MVSRPQNKFHEDRTNIFKPKDKKINILRIVYQLRVTMIMTAIPTIIQPPTDNSVYCGPMCTNTGNTQSKATSCGGIDLTDLLWEHCQYRGLYKNVAI